MRMALKGWFGMVCAWKGRVGPSGDLLDRNCVEIEFRVRGAWGILQTRAALLGTDSKETEIFLRLWQMRWMKFAISKAFCDGCGPWNRGGEVREKKYVRLFASVLIVGRRR